MSIIVDIDRLSYGGRGVGRLESGKTVFVEGAIAGDRVQIETIAEHARFDEARAVGIEQASPDRVKAACPFAGVCGGCVCRG